MGFARSSLSLLIQDAIVTVVGFLTSIYMARHLGPGQLGLLYAVNLIPSYFDKFGRVGLVDNAAIYFLGQKRHTLAEMISHLTYIALALSLACFALFALVQPVFYVQVLKGADVPLHYVWTAVLTIPFFQIVVNFSRLLMFEGRVKGFNAVNGGVALVSSGLTVTFLAMGWDFFGVLLATLIATAGGALLATVLIVRIQRPALTVNPPLIRDLFGYGWKLYLISAVGFVHQRIDLLLVALYLSPEQLSFYSLAANVGQLLWKLPNAVGNVLFPAAAKRSPAEAATLTAAACRHGVFLLALGALAGAALCTPVLKLAYGMRFLPVREPFLILLPAMVSMGVARILYPHFHAQGHPRATITAAVIAAPINVMLNLLMIPRLGIAGAAIVSSTTYTLYLGWMIREFRLRWPLPLRDLLILKSGDLATYKAAVARVL